MSLLKCFTSFLMVFNLLVSATAYAADPSPIYSNMFISYVSPADVATLADFATKKNLGGYILWTIQGDTLPPTNSDSKDKSPSLLSKLKESAGTNQDVMAYWTNWSIYTQGRAVPVVSYPIPGSHTANGPAQNTDLSAKLPYIKTLAYAFLEIEAAGSPAPGTIYFNDPWADLLPNDPFCTSSIPNADSSCTYAVKPGKTFAESANYGNFEAFAALPTTYSGLNTVISVGGYSHDDGFEATFGNNNYYRNFANSAVSIINNYNLSGIDLDYENPSMTNAQSQDYLALITALDAALPQGKYITVTVLAGPDYLNGKNGIGFAPGVLAQIAALSHVKQINLMTYDFHGAFDYTGDSNGKTGFLSNTYMPTDAPAGYDPKFSVETSAQALLNQSVPATKVGVGIPAYGRALSNIQPNANGGLFQTLTANTLIPAGDLDPAGCSQTVPLSSTSCSGSFSYSYIIENMLSAGFTAIDHTDVATDDSKTQNHNGTTAFAATFSPAPASDYSLEITNTGGNGYAWINSVTITDGTSAFVATDFANSSLGDKTYDVNTTPSTSPILPPHNRNLTIQWTTWNQTGVCNLPPFDFTANTHVMVRVLNDGSGSFDCAVTQ
ncbi:MAG: hypothetical protein K5Q00_07340 [Gammaproteobacteria bacterium]|nr:hypothetical protein [Gammaproteobacteria bacterium]